MRREYELLVIGGGAAGMSAALKAAELGLKRIALVDDRGRLGGILPQCIHPGFGLVRYGEDLTGPELAENLAEHLSGTSVDIYTNTMALELNVETYDKKVARALGPKGPLFFTAKAIIYAAGCRERHIFEIGVTGSRPAGVYTAGEAQAMMDIYGVMPGREVVIVGSGDVGLIMARRLVLEGAQVKAVVEAMPYPGGLTRNLVQCLYDFEIPLLLSHKVTAIKGEKRVKSVVLARVSGDLTPIPGSETEIECDTVIVSAGLVPNYEILERAGAFIDPSTRGPMVNDWLETTLPGVFAAGNVLVINDLVDYAIEQGEWAAESAVLFIRNGGLPAYKPVRLTPGRNVRLAVPQVLTRLRDTILYVRPLKPCSNAVLKLAGEELKLPVVKPSQMIRTLVSKENIKGLPQVVRLNIEPGDAVG